MEQLSGIKKQRLIIYPQTTKIWHVMPEEVIVWDMEVEQVTGTCAGKFVGIARNGRHFLTYHPKKGGQAWETASGREIPLKTVQSADYEFHQRAVAIPRPDINKATLEIRDLLGKYEPLTIFVGNQNIRPPGPTVRQEIMWGWKLLPQRRLALLVWAIGGFDHTEGKVFDLDYEAQIGTFRAILPGHDVLLFEEQDYLVSAGTLSGIVLPLNAFSAEGDVEENKSRWRYDLVEGDATCMSIHPQHPYEFAVLLQNSGFPDEVHIYQPVTGKPKREQEVTHKLIETGTIKALTHHPNGRLLATVLSNGDIHLWDIHKGVLKQTLSTRTKEERTADVVPDEHTIKKKWERPKQRPYLVFHPTEPLLWHESDEQIHAWDITAQAWRYAVPGAWVGRSRAGDSFLTLIEGDPHAWQSENGKEIPLQKIDPSVYDLDQRWVFRGNKLPAKVYGWDVFFPKSAVTIFPNSRDRLLENWVLAPNEFKLFLAMLGQEEMAHVECWDLATQTYRYRCRRDAYGDHFYFTENAAQFLAFDYRMFIVYDIHSGKEVGKVEPYQFGRPFAFHPQLTDVCAFVNKGQIQWGVWGRKAEDVQFPPVIQLPMWDMRDLCFAPDGRSLAVLHRKAGTIQLWDVTTGLLQQEFHS